MTTFELSKSLYLRIFKFYTAFIYVIHNFFSLSVLESENDQSFSHPMHFWIEIQMSLTSYSFNFGHLINKTQDVEVRQY